MKVKDLIVKLQNLQQDADIKVAVNNKVTNDVMIAKTNQPLISADYEGYVILAYVP